MTFDKFTITSLTLMLLLTGCSFVPVQPTCCGIYDIKYDYLVSTRFVTANTVFFDIEKKVYDAAVNHKDVFVPTSYILVPLEKAIVEHCPKQPNNPQTCYSKPVKGKQYIIKMRVLDSDNPVLGVYELRNYEDTYYYKAP